MGEENNDEIDVCDILTNLDQTRTLRIAGLPLSVQYDKNDFDAKMRELISGTFNFASENIEKVIRVPVKATDGQDAEVQMLILFKSRVHRNRVFQQRTKLSDPIQIFTDANPLSVDGSPKRMTRSAAKKSGTPEKAPEPESVVPESETPDSKQPENGETNGHEEKMDEAETAVAAPEDKTEEGQENGEKEEEKMDTNEVKEDTKPEEEKTEQQQQKTEPQVVEAEIEKKEEEEEFEFKVEDDDDDTANGDSAQKVEEHVEETKVSEPAADAKVSESAEPKEEEVKEAAKSESKPEDSEMQDTDEHHEEDKEESKKQEAKARIDWAGAPEFQWKKIVPDQAADKSRLVHENVSLSDFFHPFMYQVIQRSKGFTYECYHQITKGGAQSAVPWDQHNIMGKGRLTLNFATDNQAMFNAASYLVFFRSPGNRRVKILLPQTNSTTKMRSMLERRMGHVIETSANCAQLLVRKVAADVDEDKVKQQFGRFKDEIKTVEFKNNAQGQRCAVLSMADAHIAAITHIYHDWVSLNEKDGFSRVYHMADINADDLLPKFEARKLKNTEKMKRKAEEPKTPTSSTPAAQKADDKPEDKASDSAKPEAKKARVEETKKEETKKQTPQKDFPKKGGDRAGFRGGRGRGTPPDNRRGNDRRDSGGFRGGSGGSFRGTSGGFRGASRGFSGTSSGFRGTSGGFRGGRGGDRGRGAPSSGGGSFRPMSGSNSVRSNERTPRGGGSSYAASKLGGFSGGSQRGARGSFDRNNRRGGRSPPMYNRASGRDNPWQGGVVPFGNRGAPAPGPAPQQMGGGPMGGPGPASYQDLAGMLMQQQQTLDYQNQLLQQQQVISELAGRLSGGSNPGPPQRLSNQGMPAPGGYSNPPGRGSGGGYQQQQQQRGGYGHARY